jgi:hypothetical protein
MGALNTIRVQTAPRFELPSFAKMRAKLPTMKDESGSVAAIAGMVVKGVLAAVPFAALAWLFVAV